MRIHVITNDVDSNNILARLACDLIHLPDWTFGADPNPKADINYYVPYLNYDGFTGTKTAAWFTHYDENWPEKTAIWERVAKAVDLRLTSAEMYADMLRPFGPTNLVTTPLDREKFIPKERRPRNAKPVIGTSGYVYSTGRKGEKLLMQLAHDLKKSNVFCASGNGWPVPTQELDWETMPDFYRRLDLYVCTSLIEGIGYGPLEAMACGIPVVIPRGVGVFDELPDVQFIYRYKRGDYASLLAAVQAALAEIEPVNVESLRGITARFTKERWQHEHVQAFEDFLFGVMPVGELPAWHDKAGLYIVAYGEPARECAKRLIKSFRHHMSGIPIAMASTEAGCGEDIFIECPDEDIGGRSVKTKIYNLAPPEWQYVMYLDADTEVTADIGFLFDLLMDGWEAVFCINPAQYCLAREMHRPDNAEECQVTFKQIGTEDFLQLNGGVFTFRRCERTAKFFNDWHEEWARFGRRDQAALDRVLYREPIRLYVLGNEWNTVTRYIAAERTAGILHYCMEARRWRGMLPGRLDSGESWAALHPASVP